MSIIKSNNNVCISDAVQKFYIESGSELTPYSNYYFGLYINEYLIAYLKKLKLTI